VTNVCDDQKGDRRRNPPNGRSEMGTKRVGKPAKKPVSSKAQADPAAEKKYRGEARADRTAEAAD
jgi:hypothetical protein